jgi:hypothetical protein
MEAEKALNNLTARIEQATKFEVRIWIRSKGPQKECCGPGFGIILPDPDLTFLTLKKYLEGKFCKFTCKLLKSG